MKKRILDPTISVGNIISLIGMVCAIGAGYANIISDLNLLKYQVTDTQVRISSIESKLYNKNTAQFLKPLSSQVNYYEEKISYNH